MPERIERHWFRNRNGEPFYTEERVYEYAPLVRSQSEIDEIDYISEIAMELMEKDPEDRRSKNWKPLS